MSINAQNFSKRKIHKIEKMKLKNKSLVVLLKMYLILNYHKYHLYYIYYLLNKLKNISKLINDKKKYQISQKKTIYNVIYIMIYLIILNC